MTDLMGRVTAAGQMRKFEKDARKAGRKCKPVLIAPGLYLIPRQRAKDVAWYAQLRWQQNGGTQWHSLGTYDAAKHEQYQEEAAKARQALAEKTSPLNVVGRSSAVANGYAAIAEAFIVRHVAGLRNPKDVKNALSCIRKRNYRGLGNLSIDKIGPADVERALAGDWNRTPASARKAAGRIFRILRFGFHKTGLQNIRVNPADPALLEQTMGKQKKKARRPSYAERSIGPDEIPAAFRELATTKRAGYRGFGAQALRFLILTVARSKEVADMTWDQISWDTKSWDRSDEFMKMDVGHRVALSEPALALLRELEPFRGNNPFVFQGQKPGTSITQNVIRTAMSKTRFGKVVRVKIGDKEVPVQATPHGFRTSFSDWHDKNHTFPEKVVSACLAHVRKQDAEREEGRVRRKHYSNADRSLFNKRRELMELWGQHVTATAAAPVALVASAA